MLSHEDNELLCRVVPGTPMGELRRKFEESLAVLEALLTREEVSWDGAFYKFAPITVMPFSRAIGMIRS